MFVSLGMLKSSSLGADVRNGARLLRSLGGNRRFALAVFVEHGQASLCIARLQRLWRYQIAWIGNHRGRNPHARLATADISEKVLTIAAAMVGGTPRSIR